jgi:hypothetical protein
LENDVIDQAVPRIASMKVFLAERSSAGLLGRKLALMLVTCSFLAVAAGGVGASTASAACVQTEYASSGPNSNSQDVSKQSDTCTAFNEYYPVLAAGYWHGWYFAGNEWREGAAGDVLTPEHGIGALITNLAAGTLAHSQSASYNDTYQNAFVLY